MAETTEQDPSIEEILASIRQIISDDDEVEDSAEDTMEDVSEPEPEPEPESDEDVFELTKDMEEINENINSDIDEDANIDFQEQGDEEYEAISEAINVETENGEIFTDMAANVTVDGFKKLSEKVALSSYSDNITLEEIVKDMLRPMLREWIDSNMPQLVEVLVEKELEKLARHAKDS